MDDEVITEAPAILLAISTLAPELNLYGSTTIERIRVAEWLNWISGTLHSQGFGALFRPQRFTEDKTLHPELKRQGYVTVTKLFGEIDKKLEGKTFAVGDSFTVVDAFLFPFWRWGNMSGIKMADDYPTYTALVTRVRERKSAKAALHTEKIATEEFGSSASRL
jgi:glutathione S-transferase